MFCLYGIRWNEYKSIIKYNLLVVTPFQGYTDMAVYIHRAMPYVLLFCPFRADCERIKITVSTACLGITRDRLLAIFTEIICPMELNELEKN